MKELISLGRIRMVYPENKAADEHFENLRKQYAGTVARAKALVDEATETNRFIGESLKVEAGGLIRLINSYIVSFKKAISMN